MPSVELFSVYDFEVIRREKSGNILFSLSLFISGFETRLERRIFLAWKARFWRYSNACGSQRENLGKLRKRCISPRATHTYHHFDTIGFEFSKNENRKSYVVCRVKNRLWYLYILHHSIDLMRICSMGSTIYTIPLIKVICIPLSVEECVQNISASEITNEYNWIFVKYILKYI